MVQQVNSTPDTENVSPLFDPYLLRVAQHIYEKCYEIYPYKAQQMQGVAIDRETYRGQLIFKEKPILLPWETFIPSEEIDTDEVES
ncbi:MAG: hypothetical protein ACLFRN_08040 [Halothece sp.]